MAEHEVHKMLALSTGHVTDITRDVLNDDDDGFGYNKGDYGWFICVPEIDLEEDETPEDLKAIFTFARTHNYTWLMFDCDAPTVEELPLFPW